MHAQQQLGRDCYARKEYTKALEHFDRALSAHKDSVSLLDQRAACHAQLHNLPAALKDARRAIHLAREDPTGYLRAAKVLVRMEKMSVARDLLTHGLKCVKHVGKGYEALQKMHETLSARMGPARTDPFTVLPRELGLAILQMLDFRARVALMRTSKQWAEFVRSEPGLWSDLDFTAARKYVPARFFSKVMNRARTKITSATLTKYNIESPGKFVNVLDALARHTALESLSLLECGIITAEMINKLKAAKHLQRFKVAGETQILDSTYGSLTQVFPQLEEVDFHIDKTFHQTLNLDYSRMTAIHLTLPGCGRPMLTDLQLGLIEASSLQSFTFHCPEMPRLGHPSTYLSDINLGACNKLQALHLHGMIQSLRSMTLPRSIRKLYIGSTFTTYQTQSIFRVRMPASELYHFDLPLLEDLEINAPDGPLQDILEALNTTPPLGGPTEEEEQRSPSIHQRLERLVIHRADGNVGTVFSQSPPLTNLRHLGLREIHGLQDGALVTAVRELPQLRSLDVSMSQITGVAIRDVVTMRRKTLETLVLDDCFNIGRDAVDWARTQGVRVQCRLNMNHATGGGKKVRY